MKFWEKTALILFFLGVAAIPFLLPNSSVGPWDFGFLAVAPANPSTSVGNYISNMHIQSKMTVNIYSVINELTGLGRTMILIPGVIFLAMLAYAGLPKTRRDIRILSTFVIVAGPVTILTYTWRFRRDGVDLIIILLALLSVIILERYRSLGVWVVLAAASIFLWFNHYTIWPFFVIIAVSYLVLSSIGRTRTKRAVGGSGMVLFAPFILNLEPAYVFINSVVAIFYVGIPSFTRLFAAGFRGVSIDAAMFVTYNRPDVTAWMPEAAYGIYFLCLSALGAHYIGNSIRSRDFQLHPRRCILIATMIAFLVVAPLLVVRGYVSRVVVLWPILTFAFLSEYLRVTDFTSPLWSAKLPLGRTVVAVLVVISMAHVMPIAITDYPNNPNDFSTDRSQDASAAHLQYIPEESAVYTDLNHATLIKVQGWQHSVITGASEVQSDSRVAVDQTVEILYRPWKLTDGYILVSTERDIGTRTWGGPLPPVDLWRYENVTVVYDNGENIISRR